MTRKQILIRKQELIHGNHPDWIKDYQKVMHARYDTNFSPEDIEQILDDMCDYDMKFEDVEDLYNYELSIQNDLSELEKTADRFETEKNYSKKQVKKLQAELIDIHDAIEKAFLTINDLQPYFQRKEHLETRLEDLIMMQGLD